MIARPAWRAHLFLAELIIPTPLTRALGEIRDVKDLIVTGNIDFVGKNRALYASVFKRFLKIIAEKRYELIEKQ